MSEYIPRLREELVAAASRERAGERRRPALRPRSLAPVLVAAGLAAVVLAVSTIDLADDERPVPAVPAGELAFRVSPAPGADVAEAADLLRARLIAAGLGNARVTVTGDRLGVDAGRADLATVAALAVPGELRIYDWETTVLGPDGRPAPGDEQVTGGDGAGQIAAVSRDEAVQRAAKAKGARVVQAEGATGGWYALDDRAAVTNADIAKARAATDPATGDPVVVLDFTAQGRSAFGALTRTIAERGATTMQPGTMRGVQHLAIVLDDRIMSVPFINSREVPNGIDGSEGAQIQGGLSGERARQIATILDTGPIPATLEPL